MSPAPRNAFLIAILLGTNAIHAQEQSHNWAQRRPIRFEELQNGFSEPDMIYAPFTFWFWDEPLDADKAAKMARKMTGQRLNLLGLYSPPFTAKS